MANALAVLDKNVPAYLKTHTRKNIKDTVTINSLGIAGKTFAVSIEGEQKKLQSRNAEGDLVPMSVLRVIVVDFAPRRGRSYYEGVYDPTKATPPVCWSVDGVKPHDNVPEKQAPKCDGCPNAVKGSGLTGKGMACTQHLMLAVLLVGQKGVTMIPLRLKLAITSIWDADNKEANEDGWFAWDQYVKELKKKGVDDTSTVVTKITFDPNENYPKLMFGADRYVDDDTYEAIRPIVDGPEVKELLDATWTPAGVDGVKASTVEPYKGKPAAQAEDDEGDGETVVQPRAVTRKRQPQIIDAEATETAVEQPATRRRAAAAVEEAPQPTARRRAVVEEAPADDDDDEEAALQKQLEAARAKKAAKAAAAAAPAAEEDPKPRRRAAAVDAGDEDPKPRRRAAAAVEVDEAPAARKAEKPAPKKVDALFDSWGED